MKRIDYFPYQVPIRKGAWNDLRLDEVVRELSNVHHAAGIRFFRHLSMRYSKIAEGTWGSPGTGDLLVFATILRTYHYLMDQFTTGVEGPASVSLLSYYERPKGREYTLLAAKSFVDVFPGRHGHSGTDPSSLIPGDGSLPSELRNDVAREIFLLRIANMNRATFSFRELHRDDKLLLNPHFKEVVRAIFEGLERGPIIPPFGVSLVTLFLAPIKASPDSLAGQLDYIRREWAFLLPPEILARIEISLKILADEEVERGAGGPGPPQIWKFDRPEEDYGYPEYARYTEDTDWMPNTVLLAKMVYVWLTQLSRQYGRPITRLNDIPDEELDRLARWGFNGLWLIGIWERSPASKKIKDWCGNGADAPSAYSIYDYSVAEELGGWEDLQDLKGRAWNRGIRLACDMVPNHMGIYSRWVVEHPDWFIQTANPPYPRYRFTGSDLSSDGRVTIQIEDGYYDRQDAAVVFKLTENDTGRVRYIYHGNDGTSTPWNDTAQLNYLLPEVREELTRAIMRVAHNFPIIRFDAAMTLTKRHFQRLWYPALGHGPSIPSRAEEGLPRSAFDEYFPQEFWREVVDRAAREAPDTLMIAEAFWLMESYFVRTLGMHRVYNSAFMHMLKLEDNAGYRRTLKNILQFDPRILQRLVNFMNNPDEKTAVEQFGKGGKYMGVAVLLVTMPGLPMFGHGQVEGYGEKYGMEFTHPHLGEEPDHQFISLHEEKIFPLLRRRRLFSGAKNFALFDFFSGNDVNENVIAYSNMLGEDRAIVAYHNRYAEAKGWIRNSVAMKSVENEEESEKIRTLGEVLGLRRGDGLYYAFQDAISGLEYLRSGRELCQEGLYLELGAYDVSVFSGFREIIEDGEGNWGKVAWALKGTPVRSLIAEYRAEKYRELTDALKSVAEEYVSIFSEEDSVGNGISREGSKKLDREARRFFSIVKDKAGGGESHKGIGLFFKGGLQVSRDLIAAGPDERQVNERLGSPSYEAFLHILYLAFRSVDISGRDEDGKEHEEPLYREFSFIRAAREVGEILKEKGMIEFIKEEEPTLLIESALSHRELLLNSQDGRKFPAEAARLFSHTPVRDYLLVHEFEGRRYFHRERFHSLLRMLIFTALVEVDASINEDSLSLHETLLKSVKNLQKAAEKAGYRIDLFMENVGKGDFSTS